MALGSEPYRNPLLSGSLKNTNDEKLLLELARRGYDVSRLRDTDEKTAEIVKITV